MTAALKRPWPGPATAPYDRAGNLEEWVHGSAARAQETAEFGYGVPAEWRPNDPFWATLVLTGVERGRSAARFIWQGTGPLTGHRYPMFMTDMADLAMSADGVANATATGWWIVVKRGANYGIMRLRPEVHPLGSLPWPDGPRPPTAQ